MGEAQNPTPWPVARKHRRAPLNVPVEIQQGGRTFRGRTGNISEGGIFVVTPFPFAPYTELKINFLLPGEVSIEALGVVRHRKAGAHMGLMFVELTEAARSTIAEHVSKAHPITAAGRGSPGASRLSYGGMTWKGPTTRSPPTPSSSVATGAWRPARTGSR